MNVILACDYPLLSAGDKREFELRFREMGSKIRYCYLHSHRPLHRVQGLLVAVHPVFMIRVWMLLLGVKRRLAMFSK